jgi:DNA-binding MarR family transcriptional regulator
MRTDSEAREQAIALRRGALRLARRLRRERGPAALSNAKLSVLAALHRGGEMTARQIADLERLQPQSLTRTLRDLEAAALVRRRADPDDRRRARLAITGKGIDALALEMADRDAWLAAALAEHLTPAERGVLELAAELMQRLAEVPTE